MKGKLLSLALLLSLGVMAQPSKGSKPNASPPTGKDTLVIRGTHRIDTVPAAIEYIESDANAKWVGLMDGYVIVTAFYPDNGGQGIPRANPIYLDNRRQRFTKPVLRYTFKNQ